LFFHKSDADASYQSIKIGPALPSAPNWRVRTPPRDASAQPQPEVGGDRVFPLHDK